jgi:LysR family transcriptional regulator, hydrogen peroxide-inducible genes activator
MNLQQLDYIISVDMYRHFGKAASACHVTQPTLSMMIQRLEEELEVKIFDRNKKPVVPTETGALIIEQARVVLKEAARMREIVQTQKEVPEGNLHLGIIPTLAPYLLPLFLKSFLEKYPKVHLKIEELTTDNLVDKLKKGLVDVGVLVTPLHIPAIREIPLFYEAFLVYSSHEYDKEYLLPEDIDPNELWLLEEGHCFRSQILHLCELRRKSDFGLEYEAGSIETLKRLVDHQNGVTILPELATHSLLPERRRLLKPFRPPAPVREVSLATHRDYVKKHLIDVLQEEILAAIPDRMKENDGTTRVGIND